jgi:hypothetical protein
VSSAVSDALRARIRAHAGDACVYCRSPQRLVLGPLEIDHIVPKARGGTDEEENLCLACRMCNSYKGTQTHGVDALSGHLVRLFNARTEEWSRHFQWSISGSEVVGRTATGRATVAALQLNNVLAVMVRQSWIAAGWHPPAERGGVA